MNNRIIVLFLCAAACLATACKKQEDPNDKLVGTWLMKTSGSDKNGNSVYDESERVPADTGNKRYLFRFDADHTYRTIVEVYAPDSSTLSLGGKWQRDKDDPNKISFVADDGKGSEVGIEVLTDTELITRRTSGTEISWNSYIKQ